MSELRPVELQFLRMLTRKKFFMTNNDLVRDDHFSSTEVAMIRQCIVKVYHDNPSAHGVRKFEVRQLLQMSTHHPEDYSSLLSRIWKLEPEPDPFQEKLVSELVTRAVLKVKAKEIMTSLQDGKETPDVDQLIKDLQTLSNQSDPLIDTSVNYSTAEAEYINYSSRHIEGTLLSRELDKYCLLSGGEIGVWEAEPGGGKTTIFANMAKRYLLKGLNVAWLTLDEPKARLVMRVDQSLLALTSEELRARPALGFKAKEMILKICHEKGGGWLEIVDCTFNKTTVAQFETVLYRMEDRGRLPSLIIVDFADKLKAPGLEGRPAIDEIYDDLKRLSSRHGAPVWTASQVRRENYGWGKKGLDSPALSIAKAENATVFIAVERNVEADAGGKWYAKILKSRDRSDRPMILMGADWDRQVIMAY